MSVENSNEQAEFNNYTDRCDRCRVAQGQKKVIKGDLLLIFCNHDFNVHEAALIASGWSIIERKAEEPVEKKEEVLA